MTRPNDKAPETQTVEQEAWTVHPGENPPIGYRAARSAPPQPSEREAFEKWAGTQAGEWLIVDGLLRDPRGEYWSPRTKAAWLAWQAARAAPPQPVPAEPPLGWKLVPIEPTAEMEKAGGHANSEWLNDDAPLYEQRYAMPMKSVWQAMLAATPLVQPAPPPIQGDLAGAQGDVPGAPAS
jgi:hypothetical protein